LQQVNDQDYTLDLEERVISLKARIREMKMKIGDYDHQGRKEPKLDFQREPAPEKSDIMAIKAKLLGRA
tara:strand:- start:345 stop:551 length:207 start_codon:yes stop_codon:yes gene_type:complete